MKNISRFLLVILIPCCIILFNGCGAYMEPVFEDPGQTPVPMYKFDYSISTHKKLHDPLTFLLISPSYKVDFPQIWTQGIAGLSDIIRNFSSAIEKDFNELMVERGFRLISLVKDQQMATYSQREQSIFSLTSKIEIMIDASQNKSSEVKQSIGSGIIGARSFEAAVASGEFNVKTRIVLEVYEPITWQLIWVKTIEEIESKSISYMYKWNYTDTKTWGVKIGADTRPQSLADILMGVYKNTLSKCEIYLDPDEFAILSKQAEDIRLKATSVVK